MNNNYFDVDTYYLGHPNVKINKEKEISLMFNRVKPQIMFGLEEIIYEEFGHPRTAEELFEAGKGARGWGLSYPMEFFEPVQTECNGYLPIKIKGLVSGEYAPKNTPFIQVENTMPEMGPCAPWAESMLMHGWFGTACTSHAYEMAQYLKKLKLDVHRIHDFSLRSYPHKACAKIGGLSWFMGGLLGTDNFMIAQWIQVEGAGSIPAMAHTLVQNFGMQNELQAYKRFIDVNEQKGYKTIAIVIDTYSSQNFIDKYLDLLMEIANEKGMTFVFRPDSGDVIEYAIQIYNKAKKRGRLGCTKVIIGENVSFERIKEWDSVFQISGVPLDFIVYGIGSNYHQHLSRDTHGWAMKTCYVEGNEKHPVMKFADTAIKMSIPGPIDLVRTNDTLVVTSDKKADDLESAYTILYEYDPRHMKEPYIFEPNSLEWIMQNVQKQNTSQKEIYYSKAIKELKEQLIKSWKSSIG